MGTPITFFAEYETLFEFESHIFVFQDKYNVTRRQEVNTVGVASATFIYDRRPEVDHPTMTVTVFRQWMGSKLWPVESPVDHMFEISNHLIGNISISQETTPVTALTKFIVSSAEPVIITFDLHDPSRFFDSFAKSYTWSIDGESVANFSDPQLNHTFTSAGRHDVSVYVFALSAARHMDRSVNITTKFTVKDSIQKLKYSGKTFISRNQTLDLKVTCVTGSGPFSICEEFDPNTEDNCTILHNSRQIDDCRFNVTHYFRYPGKHNVSLRVTNDVSSFYDRIEIQVVDFTVQPSISFVVIPVVCSIMAILIVVFGIAIHLQHRKRFTVEVADFDFSARDESLIEKTFWERLRESIVTGFKETFTTTNGSGIRRRGRRSDAETDSECDYGYVSTSVRTC